MCLPTTNLVRNDPTIIVIDEIVIVVHRGLGDGAFDGEYVVVGR